MSAVTKRMAKDLAPDLDNLIDEFLHAFPGNREADKLHRFLWDNKAGILRVLEAHAGRQD